MFLADTNVWLALTLVPHPAHGAAEKWFAERGPEDPATFCRATEQSFLRLISTPALSEPLGCGRITNSVAWDCLQQFLSLDAVTRITENIERVNSKWEQLGAVDLVAPKVWMDSYLAALAISENLPFVTFDKDFRKFESSGLHLDLLNVQS